MSKPGGESRDLLIGFDLGTSAVKAILVDTSGTILATSDRAIELITPGPGRFEIDPEQYFDGIVSILEEAADRGASAGTIRAVSFCAASGNTILLDGHYQPIRNVISWLDERARNDEAVPEGLDRQGVVRTVGWGWNGGFPMAHLAWLRKHEPESWERARFFAMNNDYLYYRLTGRLVVDPSKATTFYLQNQKSRTWHREYLDMLGLSESNLPNIVPTASAVGPILPGVAKRTGLPSDTVVAAGAFDHPSAARSTGIFDEGDLLISAGTSWVAFAPVQDRSIGVNHGMLTDPFLSPDGCWGVMFALTAVANRIDTLLEALIGGNDARPEDPYGRFNALAAGSRPGAGGLLINPWEESVDEVVRVACDAPLEDVMRALMEGCCFLMRHRIERVAEFTGRELGRIVMVGGPTKSPLWPQILADILGHPLTIPETGSHAGAMGASILAGMSVGIYRDEREGFAATRAQERVVAPDSATLSMYEQSYRRFLRRFEPDD